MTAPLKSLLLIFSIASLPVSSFSQEIVPDSNAIPAIRNLVKDYSYSLLPQLHLFNGIEYPNYRLPFYNGHPYFKVDSLTKGSIHYDGNMYNNASLLYNIATDQLVVLSHDNFSKIQLLQEKVSSFSLLGHEFINIPRDSLLFSGLTKGGFYDIISQGKITLLAKRIKTIQTKVTNIVELQVFHKDIFYLKKDNLYIAINNEKAFLKAIADKKPEVQKFIKQNRLNYKLDREGFMKRVLAYYNEL